MNAFASLSLGSFVPAQARTYRFTVTFLQSAAVPALQGAASSMQLTFLGVAQ